MLFSLLYFFVGRILGTGRRPDERRDVELLVLRHQVRVLQRKVKRPRLRRLDRVLLAAASRVERCLNCADVYRLQKEDYSSHRSNPGIVVAK